MLAQCIKTSEISFADAMKLADEYAGSVRNTPGMTFSGAVNLVKSHCQQYNAEWRDGLATNVCMNKLVGMEK